MYIVYYMISVQPGSCLVWVGLRARSNQVLLSYTRHRKKGLPRVNGWSSWWSSTSSWRWDSMQESSCEWFGNHPSGVYLILLHMQWMAHGAQKIWKSDETHWWAHISQAWPIHLEPNSCQKPENHRLSFTVFMGFESNMEIWNYHDPSFCLFFPQLVNRIPQPKVNIGQIPRAPNTFCYSGVVCHTWLTHMAQFALVGYQSASGASGAAGVNSPRVNIDHIPLNTCQNFKQISSSMMSRVSR